METLPYVVQQGDYLTKLAVRYGFDADTAWGLPDNKPLRDLGRDPNMLLPGDVLYLPKPKKTWLAVSTGTANAFSAKQVFVKVGVRFVENGKGLANEPYVVEGADVPPGTLDGDGNFEADVPTSVSSFVVRLTQRLTAYSVNVGHLDPLETESGLLQRLAHLGHVPASAVAPTDDEDDDDDGDDGQLADAIRRFQFAAKLPATGELDDDTLQQLKTQHGS